MTFALSKKPSHGCRFLQSLLKNPSSRTCIPFPESEGIAVGESMGGGRWGGNKREGQRSGTINLSLSRQRDSFTG